LKDEWTRRRKTEKIEENADGLADKENKMDGSRLKWKQSTGFCPKLAYFRREHLKPSETLTNR